MVVQNTGKSSELEFQRQVRLSGGWCHRFTDLATFRAHNQSWKGKITFPAQPADYLVGLPNTGLHLAEVKSVSRKLLSIPSTLLRGGQKEAVAGSRRGGEQAYVIYLHDIPSGLWYLVNPHTDIGSKICNVRSSTYGTKLWT